VNPLAPLLEQRPLLILDGGLASELERRGCDLRDPLWSARVLIEAPELIHEVHADYLAAGADCVTTATYQATFEGFARRGYSRREAADLMRLAVRLAVDARDAFWAEPANRVGRPRPLVAASVGSYGAFLADGSEYRGDYGLSARELADFHRPRLALLADSGADLLACETIPCLLEGQALAELLAEFPQCSAWVSFSARDAAHLCHGEEMAAAAAALNGYEQVAALGVNCTAPRHIAGLLRAARSATRKPLVAYPNSGEVYCADDGSWRPGEAEPPLAELARGWVALGARLLGGCCRTTPEDIRELAELGRFAPARRSEG
jgi:homocysteine S-methyltransferase